MIDGETSPKHSNGGPGARGRYAIVRVGDQDVSTWPQPIRALADIQHGKTSLPTLPAAARPGADDTHVTCGDEEWVRVELVHLRVYLRGLMPRLTPTAMRARPGRRGPSSGCALGRLPSTC
jgi:hypothetical protein